MGKTLGPFKKGRRKLPLDFLFPTIVTILAISVMFVTDYAIEVKLTNEPANNPPPPKEPIYRYIDQETARIDGHSQEGQTTDADIGDILDNITKLKLELSWSDDIGSNDVFELSLLLNGSKEDSTDGSSGSLSLEVEGNQSLLLGLEVKVTALDCPGLLGPLPIDRDNGNDWALRVISTIKVEG